MSDLEPVTTPAPEAPEVPEMPEVPPVPLPSAGKPRRDTAFVLAIVVAVQAVVILALAGGLVAVAVTGAFMGGFGMPSAEDEQAMMVADDLAARVGVYLVDGDEKAYLDLFAEDDAFVDSEKLRDDFARASRDATDSVEYMCDTFTIYEDAETGEKIVKGDVSGFDANTGESRGGSFTIYVDVDDEQLTGIKGRELDLVETW